MAGVMKLHWVCVNSEEGSRSRSPTTSPFTKPNTGGEGHGSRLSDDDLLLGEQTIQARLGLTRCEATERGELISGRG